MTCIFRKKCWTQTLRRTWYRLAIAIKSTSSSLSSHTTSIVEWIKKMSPQNMWTTIEIIRHISIEIQTIVQRIALCHYLWKIMIPVINLHSIENAILLSKWRTTLSHLHLLTNELQYSNRLWTPQLFNQSWKRYAF